MFNNIRNIMKNQLLPTVLVEAIRTEVKKILKDLNEQQSKWHSSELSDYKSKKFRVNFGQGQVSNTFNTKKEAERELKNDPSPGGAFIEFKDLDTGDWFNVHRLKEQMKYGSTKKASPETIKDLANRASFSIGPHTNSIEDDAKIIVDYYSTDKNLSKAERYQLLNQVLDYIKSKSNIKEQRIEGDKRHSDEMDYFDTDELHLERDHDDKWDALEAALDMDDDFEMGDDFAPADESVKIREQRDIYDPYTPGPREYSDEPESIEYDKREAWEDDELDFGYNDDNTTTRDFEDEDEDEWDWDRKLVDDEREDWREDY
jgi:hypothetical protein